MNKEDILKVLKELRKSKDRKFNQSVDLIINLKNFDIKKQSVNLTLDLPNKIKEKKICAFLNEKSGIIDTITKPEFDSYKDKKKLKKLVKKYDFFMSAASLMPQVATVFGKVLGPAGKMPSPKAGIIMQETDEEIKKMKEKLNKVIKIVSKEPSLKMCIGKTDMKDEEIAENVKMVYNKVLDSLTRKKENIRNVLIKFTMSKPIKIM